MAQQGDDPWMCAICRSNQPKPGASLPPWVPAQLIEYYNLPVRVSGEQVDGDVQGGPGAVHKGPVVNEGGNSAVACAEVWHLHLDAAVLQSLDA
ncbi:hypothetical protein HaLaN_23475 [Haematococcus lacustris]|uniref:Uncharacterized protein n=1 Tax=Haematococcus lacustris TaxID=44745 RepID=A0A699ZRS1_HAELA|nr:hypothetical protein HaLaN_23475 [Haematococcus lacustris]